MGSGANWQGGAAPANDGSADVVFTDSLFTADYADTEPSLSANYAFNSLTFAGGSSFTLGSANSRGLTLGAGGLAQNSAAAQTVSVPIFLGADQTWSFAAGAGALTFNSAANPNGQIRLQGRTLALAPQGSNTLNGSIGDAGGAGALAVNGPGTITLTGSNTYTGGTAVNAGALQAKLVASLPGYGTSGKVTVNAGAGLTVNAGGAGEWTEANLNTLLAHAAFSAGSSLGIDTTDAGGSFAYTGSLAGNPGLLKLGAGTLTLSGTNTYTGGTTVSAGTLALTGGGSITDGGALNVDTGGVFTLSGSGGSVITANAAAIGIAGGGTVSQSGGSLTTNGNPLQLGNSPGSSGTYNLNGGTLNAGAVTASGGTSTFRFNGGTLQASANAPAFLQGLTTANVQAGGARVDTNGFSVTVAQLLLHDTASGAPATDGGLTKLGGGTLALTGANTYTGGTAVSAGTLLAGNTTGSATGAGAVAVNNQDTLPGGTGFVAGAVAVGGGAGLLGGSGAAPAGTLTLQGG